MHYSKEDYGSEEAKLRDAQEREQEGIEAQGSASQAERLADFTYANVAGVLDFCGVTRLDNIKGNCGD